MAETPNHSKSNDNSSEAPSNGAESQTETSDQKIRELEAAVKEKENKYLYLYAEFENFKKRVAKERSDLLRFGWEGAARELLLILDNIERAIQHAPETTDPNFLDGLKMVQQQFHQLLEKQGVQPIETNGQNFDPTLHEAIGEEPSDGPQGCISREETRGYTLHGRLLRPARVLLSAGKKD